MARTFKISVLLGFILTIANYKTLRFYFWHDDFSSFYGSQVHQCIHGWPYYSFCTIFPPLVKVFGFSPLPYYLIGNILEFASVIIFYYFSIRVVKNLTVALLTSGLLASSYVAAGIFLEAWDPFVSYLVLATLFLSLLIYTGAIKNGLNLKLFILATVIFLISISLFNFRAVTNFAPVIALIIIYANNIKFKRKLSLTIIVIILFVLVFYFIPVKILNIPIMYDQHLNYLSYLSPYKVKYLFQTISSFVLPDFIQSYQSIFIKIIIGFLISTGFIIYSFINRHDKNLTKLRIFAVIWILTMFAPYWLRDDFSLNTTHRYILWMYPGILLAWASFSKFKFWIPISLILILINIAAVNSFYRDFLSRSIKRENFYNQLHILLPKVYGGSILYFDYQPDTRQQAEDYFRVGLLPSESAIGTEYRIDYKKITLMTRSEELEKLLSGPNFPINSFYSFYYKNGELMDTTSTSRAMVIALQSEKKILLSYPYANQNIFNLRDFVPIIPTTLKVEITSTVLPMSLPYKIKCEKCTVLDSNDKEIETIFNFIKSQPSIIDIKTSDTGEKSDSKYLNDNSIETYWIGNRQLWYRGMRPFVDFTIPKKTDIDGLVIYSTSKTHIPIEFSIEDSGKKIDSSASKWTNGQKIIFSKPIKGGDHLKIILLKTDGGDVPIINELKLLPIGFKDINLEKSDDVKESQASYSITKTDYKAFINFLASGVTVCLKYKSQSYGNGQIQFRLYADGKSHIYEIKLPSMGTENPELKISCIPYPIKTVITATSLRLW